MLRRKTIIVLVITLMVTTMVTAFSVLYISQILRLRITNAKDTAISLTHQLAYAASNAVPDFSSTSIDTSNAVAVRRALGRLRANRRRPEQSASIRSRRLAIHL